MDASENKEVKSRRDQHLERMRKKYPDKKFEDDEEIFGQVSDDYDQYEQEIERYKGNEKSLSDMMSADPRSAQFLVDMHNGNDPVVSLIKNFGIEVKDVLDDPSMQEDIAKANKDYVDRVAKNKQLTEEYEKNFGNSLEVLRQYQVEKGLSDEQIDELANTMLGVMTDMVVGKFTRETLDLFNKAINHDNDVAAASEEGEIAGRNTRITEDLRKSKKGDGTNPIGGRNGLNTKTPKERSIFDVANDAT